MEPLILNWSQLVMEKWGHLSMEKESHYIRKWSQNAQLKLIPQNNEIKSECRKDPIGNDQTINQMMATDRQTDRQTDI